MRNKIPKSFCLLHDSVHVYRALLSGIDFMHICVEIVDTLMYYVITCRRDLLCDQLDRTVINSNTSFNIQIQI
jgi:hypothetical protein